MRASCAVLLAATILAAQALPSLAQPAQRAHNPVPKPTRAAPTPRPCGTYLAFQVLLDRHGLSPGEIDGKPGANFTHAIGALQEARGLPQTMVPDCETWHALGGDNAEPVLTTYTVTADDLKGPFQKQIPVNLVEQAKLPALAYKSPLEEIAERFHVSPALLEQLNHNAPLREGLEIQVPAVTPFDPAERPAPTAEADDVAIEVSREESALRVTRPDGSVVAFAPVTTGSIHDPLPPGNWTVTSVDWQPVFHYDPKLFWDAKATDTKATIKPGPNNPVGVVWISLSLEHYGLHGTPEPGHIGRTQSHGCVRMTNWDAARVASMVKRGTPVVFK